MRIVREASSWFRAIASVCLLGCVVGSFDTSAVADELPRYKMKVGQQFVYRTTDPPSESDDGRGGKNTNQVIKEWTVTVLRRNDDSTWKCLFSQNGVSVSTIGSKTFTYEILTDGYFDLAADGRLIENQTIQTIADPTPLFPPLPPDGHDATKPWEATLSFDEMHRTLRADKNLPTGQGEWRFIEEPKLALDPIFQILTTRLYVFDCQQGLVRKATTTWQQGWPAKGKSKPIVQTIELIRTGELDDQEMTNLNADVDRYFSANAAYLTLCLRASHDFSHVTECLDKAESALKEIQPQIKTSLVKAMLTNKLSQHKSVREDFIETAEEFGPQIDKPSQDWKTTDLKGNPHALADYRGKVVVLDFWDRPCSFCIRAMPQMKQLVVDFAADDVAILGVNSDEDINDAQFVADKLKLNYPTLRNLAGSGQASINSKYKVHAWPTLVVIDSKGVVRHFHTGYSPTLRHDLGEKIRTLLAEKRP